jgi:hypothetical protein
MSTRSTKNTCTNKTDLVINSEAAEERCPPLSVVFGNVVSDLSASGGLAGTD